VNSPTNLPAVASVTTIRVQDFDGWRSRFEAVAAERKEASILGHVLYRNADDPSLVSIFFTATDRARLDRFLQDPELAARQRAAGITESSHVVLLPQEDHTAKSGATAAALVSHDVEEYDRWKAGFDAQAEWRRRAGVIGHSVSRVADRPNRVVILAQSASAEGLQALSPSDELRASMQKAGVCSPPEVKMLVETGYSAHY
jgi:quinol monooxygenase YgiN